MIKIDEQKCIGCGLCVSDCFPKNLKMEGGKAHTINETCIACGHCIAICPNEAVSMEGYEEELKDYEPETFDIKPETLLNFIEFRRSVRHFTDQPVETEKIKKIIEAGRFTPTGSNAQPVSYCVVREHLPELLKLSLESLKDKGHYLLERPHETPPIIQVYAKRWVDMYEKYEENPQNPTDLFFNSKVVIPVISTSLIDAGLAASNMELMAHAEGLGCFFSGFFVRAALDNEKISQFLGLKDSEQVVACLILGYPDTKYFRTVPRNPAKINWK